MLALYELRIDGGRPASRLIFQFSEFFGLDLFDALFAALVIVAAAIPLPNGQVLLTDGAGEPSLCKLLLIAQPPVEHVVLITHAYMIPPVSETCKLFLEFFTRHAHHAMRCGNNRVRVACKRRSDHTPQKLVFLILCKLSLHDADDLTSVVATVGGGGGGSRRSSVVIHSCIIHPIPIGCKPYFRKNPPRAKNPPSRVGQTSTGEFRVFWYHRRSG